MKASLHVPKVEMTVVIIIAFGCFGSKAYISCPPHPETLSLCHMVLPNIFILSTEGFLPHYTMSQDTAFHGTGGCQAAPQKNKLNVFLVHSFTFMIFLCPALQLSLH
jgi:hypothetical protein